MVDGLNRRIGKKVIRSTTKKQTKRAILDTKIKLSLLIFFIIPLLLSSKIVFSEDLHINKKLKGEIAGEKISRETAIEVASEEARKMGFLLREIDIVATGHSENWSQCWNQESKTTAYQRLCSNQKKE